jgi:hypothetical protein
MIGNSTTLAAADRERLAKMLGLLGSDHPGERDAAGLAAHRFIRDRGLTWADILLGAPGVVAAANRNAVEAWRQTVADCLRQHGSLRPWEGDFLRSLAGFACISLKQRSVLAQIADRVLRRAAA